tara:strand:+ start:245 stop:559 length:315 start_codon:yes stop_codon:yes gene_type:complete
MAPRTWHILREDGTTVDITTKVQLTDAISKGGKDERIQKAIDAVEETRVKFKGKDEWDWAGRPVTIKVSEATHEKLSIIAYEQEVGLAEAVELVIQWGIWWRNS